MFLRLSLKNSISLIDCVSIEKLLPLLLLLHLLSSSPSSSEPISIICCV